MEYIKLGDIATYINGYSFKPSDWKTEGTPIVRIQNLTGFNGNYNYTDKEVDSKYKIKRGDILISWSASIGVYEWEGEDAFLNQHIFKVEFNKICINKQYFKYAVEQSLDKAIKFMHGSTMKHITKKYFDNILIPVPNLEQQEKIVKILNKAESLINMKRAQLDYQDELVKSRFIEMFGDTFLNTKSFEMKQIKDITQIIKGVTYKPEQVSDKGIIVLRSSNIQNSKFDLNDIVRIDKEINEKFLVKYNDIIMCNRNGSERLVGKVAKIPMSSEQMTFGTFMTIIRSPYFNYLFNFFQTEGFRRQIKMQTSVAINQISIPLLESVKVPLPPMELQNKFAEFTNQVDKLKFEIEKSLKELEDNFNSLMQKAFKGELF